MDIMLEFVNRSDTALAEYIDHIKQSNMPKNVQWDIIDVLETVMRQCQQAKDIGWL